MVGRAAVTLIVLARSGIRFHVRQLQPVGYEHPEGVNRARGGSPHCPPSAR